MKIGNIYLEEDGSVHACLCKLTPAIAKEILKRNVNNRKIRQQYIDRLTREMLSGNWTPISNGIGFDVNGNLIDGQHRLLACVKANVDIWVIIVTGLPEKAMIHSDRGIIKTLPDVLTRSGVCSNRQMVQISTFMAKWNEGIRFINDSTVAEYVELYKDSLEAVSNESRSHKPPFTCVGLCAAITEAHSIYGEKAIEFLRLVKSDIGHNDRTCPALRLRIKMYDLKGKGGFGRGYQETTYKYTCYAFNAWIQGKKNIRRL